MRADPRGPRRRTTRDRAAGLIAIALYALNVAGANWMVLNIGLPTADGPRVIPLGLGLIAPSGVLAAGATFTLRDLVQRLLGQQAAWIALVLGAFATAAFSPALALASGIAFLFSEGSDLLVYSRLEGRFVRAVLLSNTVGALVDSFVFLTLAFGLSAALALALPSILGKLEVATATLAVMLVVLRVASRRSRPRSVSQEGAPRRHGA